MRKNVIMAILTVVAIISIISLIQMSERASYWMNRSADAEEYIQALEEDFPSYIDTTSGTDAYSNYYKYK